MNNTSITIKKLTTKKFIIFLSIIYLLTPLKKGFSQDKIIVNVKDYGAVGDGKTDDYPALLKVVNYINSKGKGEVYFPAGNYYIAEFHNGNNNIQDLQFKNCDGLDIHGSNATISVNGSFNRSFTVQKGKFKHSNITAVIPLKINNCKNVTIENLELNGNVDKMTRDEGVVEDGGHLLVIIESQNVNLVNLFVHHAQTDGIFIVGSTTKNIIAEKVTSSNNARQGMSIIELTDATFTNCKFINTGNTGGNYGRHAPSAGVDIEPDHKTQLIKNIHFLSCLFENNLGSQFVCSFPTTTQDIFFNNCTFNSANNSSRFSIIVNAQNVVFQGCSFDCKQGNIYPVWHSDGCSSSFIKCNIKSSASGLVALNSFNNSKVIIDSCNLEYSGNNSVANFFPYISMQGLTFTNNIVQIPRQYRKVIGNTTLLQKSKNISNNVLQ